MFLHEFHLRNCK